MAICISLYIGHPHIQVGCVFPIACISHADKQLHNCYNNFMQMNVSISAVYPHADNFTYIGMHIHTSAQHILMHISIQLNRISSCR